jgi:hypothetical protein
VTAYDKTGMERAALIDGPNVSGLTAVAGAPIPACSDGSTPAGTPLACASGARLILFVQVNTSAAVSSVFQYPGIPRSITLRSQAIMRVAQ